MSKVNPSQGFLTSPRTRFLLRFWEEYCAHDEPPQMDRWLHQKFRSDKRLGKKDRHWYADAFFTAMRWGLSVLDADESKQASELTQESPSEAWRRLRNTSPERLFAALQDKIDRVDQAQAPTDSLANSWPQLLEQGGIPRFYADYLQDRQRRERWSEDTVIQFVKAQNERAPIWLRVPHKVQRETLLQKARELGIGAEEQGEAVAFPPDSSLPESRSDIFLQDYASQQIGLALPLKPGDLVWDCCAGGGGKTLQLAQRVGAKGLVLASDIRAYKLKDLKIRADEAGLKNIAIQTWEGRLLPSFPDAVTQAKGFAAVLVDAPCSGSGTWRRSPDSRFRSSLEQLSQLQALQQQILVAASQAVRPGGYLCYATCSWLAVENEVQVDAFLAQHPEFVKLSDKLCGCPNENSDTMYWALLRRKETSK